MTHLPIVKRSHLSKHIRNILFYALLVLLGVLFIYPLLFMFGISLVPASEVIQVPPPLMGSRLAFENYVRAIAREPYIRPLVSTLVIIGLGTFGNTLASTMAAYSFARLKWPGKDIFFIISLGTIMVPYVLTMVPLFVFWSRLGMIHAQPPAFLLGIFTKVPGVVGSGLIYLVSLFWGSIPLWLVYFGGSAYDIFLLRQFMRSIPQELFDVAEVDGASDWQIFWKIMVPLSRPAIIIVVLFHIVFMWHDLLGPLLYLSGDYATLSQSLQRFSGSIHLPPPWEQILAYSVLVTLPLLLMFLFFQRYFINGISLTGMKE